MGWEVSFFVDVVAVLERIVLCRLCFVAAPHFKGALAAAFCV
jgi:hypothetical protein